MAIIFLLYGFCVVLGFMSKFLAVVGITAVTVKLFKKFK